MVVAYNGGMKEKDASLAQYPTAMFGFAGLLLASEHHPELEEVVRSLEPIKILLESDSPHLLPQHLKLRGLTLLMESMKSHVG